MGVQGQSASIITVAAPGIQIDKWHFNTTQQQ